MALLPGDVVDGVFGSLLISGTYGGDLHALESCADSTVEGMLAFA